MDESAGVLECWGAGAVGVLELVSTIEGTIEFRIFGYQIYKKRKGEGLQLARRANPTLQAGLTAGCWFF